jgi:hypothetical protein
MVRSKKKSVKRAKLTVLSTISVDVFKLKFHRSNKHFILFIYNKAATHIEDWHIQKVMIQCTYLKKYFALLQCKEIKKIIFYEINRNTSKSKDF